MNFANITLPLKRLPMAIALTGPDLMVQWVNDYICDSLPAFDIPDLLPTLLPGCNLEEIRHTLENTHEPFSLNSPMPLLSPVLTLSPIHEEGAGTCTPCAQTFQGALMHIALFNQNSSPIALEQANRMLFQFNSQLRNPLSSIFASLSSISRQLEIEECYSCDSYLAATTQNCYKLLRVCISITEFSRFSSGLALLPKQPVPIVEFTKNLLDSAALLTRNIGATITYSLPQEEEYLICNQEKLSLALLCILSNSCCYFEGETKIYVLVEKRENSLGNTLHFRITDTGIGIPVEVMPHIFEPYYSHGKDDFSLPGLGLGLPLAKLIIAYHGGTMAVHSQPEEGTTVAFTLPINKNPCLEDPPAFHDGASSYILDRFSNLYVFLSDVLQPPQA